MTFEEYLAQHPPPDLQKLAGKYGGTIRVPDAIWSQFDRAMMQWRADYRMRHKGAAA